MPVKVSIILPSFNHSSFLKQRFDSIINQTYQDFEVILLDDCSTDNSWSVLQSLALHPKVSFCIKNDVNSGSPFKQWVKGINLAKGDWIWIAESDDYADLNFLNVLFGKLKESTDLIYSASVEIDEFGNNQGLDNWADSLDKEKWKSDYTNDGKDEINNYLIYRNTIVNASAVLFKKPNTIPPIILNMRFCGDWYFWIWLLQNGQIQYVSDALNFFRTHQGTTRMTKNQKKELIRYEEWKTTINFALTVIDSKKIPLRYYNKYQWIIKDLFSKTKIFGKFSRIVLRPPLPLFLKIYYYFEKVKREIKLIYIKLF